MRQPRISMKAKKPSIPLRFCRIVIVRASPDSFCGSEVEGPHHPAFLLLQLGSGALHWHLVPFHQVMIASVVHLVVDASII
jgi:hypothetical protein